jgi:hypothetical protein
MELTEEQAQMQMQQWSPSPTDSPQSAARTDPFDFLGITQCHESKMLFDHCKLKHESPLWIFDFICCLCGGDSDNICDIKI